MVMYFIWDHFFNLELAGSTISMLGSFLSLLHTSALISVGKCPWSTLCKLQRHGTSTAAFGMLSVCQVAQLCSTNINSLLGSWFHLWNGNLRARTPGIGQKYALKVLGEKYAFLGSLGRSRERSFSYPINRFFSKVVRQNGQSFRRQKWSPGVFKNIPFVRYSK